MESLRCRIRIWSYTTQCGHVEMFLFGQGVKTMIYVLFAIYYCVCVLIFWSLLDVFKVACIYSKHYISKENMEVIKQKKTQLL